VVNAYALTLVAGRSMGEAEWWAGSIEEDVEG
jgi:hypothetical protein